MIKSLQHWGQYLQFRIPTLLCSYGHHRVKS